MKRYTIRLHGDWKSVVWGLVVVINVGNMIYRKDIDLLSTILVATGVAALIANISVQED